MNYFLGIDAGGTKTLAQIVDQDGQVLGEGYAGGANPHNQELEDVLSNIGLSVLTAQKQAEEKVNAAVKKFTGICIGMAGLDTDDDRAKVISGLRAGMISKMSQGSILLVNDGFISLRSGTDQNFGVCLISGTGSNVYGVNRDGFQTTAGDWGFILGDGGSGYAMGRKLLRHVMKEHDGRAGPSILSQKILEHLNLRSILDLVRWVYGEEVPVRGIAGLTRLFDEPEIAALPIVNQTIEEAVYYQVSAFQAVVEKCNFDEQPFPVVLTGGLMNLSNPNFPGKLEESIRKISPQAQIINRQDPPIHGALSLARELPEKSNHPAIKKFMVKFE